MSTLGALSVATAVKVRDTCLCLHVQRAARAIARRFDEALRPHGLTNGQFSLLMSMSHPKGARIASVSTLLAMDRTTLTANLKPLQRRGLVEVKINPSDKRGRILRLTQLGRTTLTAALPVWKHTHAAIERKLTSSPERLREDLRLLG